MMIAMAANHYFDNPFRPFNDESDFNADPILSDIMLWACIWQGC
jgi:hypothetical protein